ncbi:MAG: putative membrane protein, partial [Thermoplasmatales archaeon A-plasma]
NMNVTMGAGINSTNFVPIASVSELNGSTVKIPVSPALLTGNQSSRVTMEVSANVTSMSISIQALGNNGLVTVFGPYSVMQVAYLIGAVLLFAGAFMEISVYDIDLHAFGSRPMKGGKEA